MQAASLERFFGRGQQEISSQVLTCGPESALTMLPSRAEPSRAEPSRAGFAAAHPILTA